MAGYVARRVLSLAGILVGISVVAFGLSALAPGDPAFAVLALEQPGSTPTAAAVEVKRAELGLDQPAPERYARWLAGAVRGDLGISHRGCGIGSTVR